MTFQILPGLWIGNYNNTKFILDKNISIIINCTKYINNFNINTKIYKLNVLDEHTLINNLDSILNYIHKNIADKNILIYDITNQQKGETILLCYILREGNINLKPALKLLRTKFPNCFKNGIIFRNCIKNYSKIV